ncbi:hypothetical protein [Mycolicibacterium elephantis]
MTEGGVSVSLPVTRPEALKGPTYLSEGIARVYLLGAGFSIAASAGAPSEYRLPGMRDLSDAVVEGLSERYRPQIDYHAQDAAAEAYDALRNFSFEQRYPGVSTSLVGNFERWLSFLVETPPWLSPSDHARHRAAFLEVSRLVYDILNYRELLMVNAQAQGDGCPDWLKLLAAKWSRTGAQVITFNYDRLVELAILSYGKPPPPGATSLDLHPGLLTPIAVRAGGQGRIRQTWTNFRLYKLHGSLGWWYQGPDGPPGDIVYDVGIVGGQWAGQGLYSAGETWLDWYSDLEPMIVPPAAVKSPYYSNGLLRSVWKKAAEQLQQARELVIIGFSLPATDMIVASRLSTIVREDCVITPVNNDKTVAERVCETFGIDSDSPRLNSKYLGENAIVRWVEDHAEEPVQIWPA